MCCKTSSHLSVTFSNFSIYCIHHMKHWFIPTIDFSLNCIKQNRWYNYLIHIKTMLAFLEVQPLSLDTFQCTPVYSYMSPCVEAYMSNIIWNSFDLRHECGKYYILLNFMFHGFGWINIFRQLHTKNLKQEFII